MVSIVLPTHNRGHLIDRSIKSVLSQTWQNFELIIIDDGSSDHTFEVVKTFTSDQRIKYIKLENNLGASGARNKGIESARGQYIAFQDSDDEWLPQKLEKQMKIFESLPQRVGVVYSDMWRILPNGEKRLRVSPCLEVGEPLLYQKILSHIFRPDYGIGIASAIIRKECFQTCGLFDTDFSVLVDFELFIRIAYSFDFYHLREPLVNYYMTPMSISSSGKRVEATQLIFKKHRPKIRKNRALFRKYCFWLSDHLLYRKETINQARRYLWMEFFSFPLNPKPFLKASATFLGLNEYLKLSDFFFRTKKNTLRFGK